MYDAVDETVSLGLIPQENTIFGTVTETYDLLRSEDLGASKWIRGTVVLPVRHCLLVRKGQKMEGIRKIMSHEQVNK